MALTSAQQKRLSQIGNILIEEGFHDVLVQTNLLDKIGFLDRIRANIVTIGSSDERLCNVLRKIGSTGLAFAYFASHRPDLIAPHFRHACAKLILETRNQVSTFDSQTATKMLRRLDAKSKFEILPFLVTPFASHYRSTRADSIAILFHKDVIANVHFDLTILQQVLSPHANEQSEFLLILSEFSAFVVDYFAGETLAVKKKNSDGLLFSASPGISLYDSHKVLKQAKAADVSRAIMQTWLNCIFEKQSLLYDLFAWEWATHRNKVDESHIVFSDVHPVVKISDKDKRVLLTYFLAIHIGDEQTAAACLVNMCDATNSTLDFAERLVSDHCAMARHPFEAGIAILENATSEGLRIKSNFAKIAASASAASSLINQYTPHDHLAFDLINQLLAAHDIDIGQMILKDSKTVNEMETARMKTAPAQSSSTLKAHAITTETNQSIDRLAIELNKSSNRIAYSAIIAAFTIAGALLISNASQTGIILLGVPFFVIAFFTSLILIASIVQEPKN